MKILLLLCVLSSLFTSCAPPQSVYSQQESELIESVLVLACNNQTRQMYERRIEEQKRILTDSQFRKSFEEYDRRYEMLIY